MTATTATTTTATTTATTTTTRGWISVPIDPDEAPPALPLALATGMAVQAGLGIDAIAIPGHDPAHDHGHGAGPAILEHLAASPPDLVCMGTRGHRGIGELLLGSVAHHVVAHASVPVLLVGPKVKEVPDTVRRLVACVDGSPQAQAALTVADRLRRRLGAELFLVEVVDPDIGSPGDTFDSVEVSRIAHQVDRGPHADVDFDVLHGPHPAAAIVDYTKGIDATVLVVGTHGRTGVRSALLGSVAQAVVAASPLPTLVVPPGVDPATFMPEVPS
jgi:nucleotide-binding universal stress UspA family protein